MADLKLTDVGKTYGGTVNVLKDINLDIDKGELPSRLPRHGKLPKCGVHFNSL